MLHKRLRLRMAAAALLLGAGIQPAVAETYLNVDCYCDPKTDAKPINGLTDDSGKTVVGCICSESYTLAKFETKDFRFRCKSANAIQIPGFDVVADRDKPTTCTLDEIAPFALDYISKSCTNWSTLSTDTVKLQTVCTAK